VPLDLSPQDWKTQHDEISKAINRLVIVVIGFSFFCALALGAPDRNLLASDAKVGLPFANTEISYVYFLFIGPIVLVALSFYLLVFVGYWLSLSQSRQITVENPTHLPFMFNLGSKTAKYISYFLFYWLVPSVLMLFAWKALPRPESNVLVAVTSSFVVIFVFLQLRRRSAILSYLHLRRRFAHVYVFCLWLVLFVGLFVSVRSSWAFLLSRSNENVFTRTLHLRKADLSRQDLRSVNLTSADLSEANLNGADLDGAVLDGAQLPRANLQGAKLQKASLFQTDLTGADLSNADLSDSVIGRAHFNSANLAGAKLSKVEEIMFVYIFSGDQPKNLLSSNLEEFWGNNKDFGPSFSDSNLSNADLSRANLRWADFSRAKLSGANLIGATIRHANLNSADLTDAKVSEGQLESAKGDETTILPQGIAAPKEWTATPRMATPSR